MEQIVPKILERQETQKYCNFMNTNTAWKVSKYGTFSSPYLVQIQKNANQKKLRIRHFLPSV